jgi:hypothetical protein
MPVLDLLSKSKAKAGCQLAGCYLIELLTQQKTSPWHAAKDKQQRSKQER